jgi:protein TonB
MNTEKKVKLCIICASVALHLAVLFCVVFNVAAKEARLEETAPLRIVDLTEYVEAPPAPVPRPRVKEPPRVIEPVAVQEEIAETVVETEEEQTDVPSAVDAVVDSEGLDSAGSAPNGTGSAPDGTGSAPAAPEGAGVKYVKENYNYVQRRILQQLIYPSQARRTGVQGVVEVIFTINANGSVSDISVRRSSGKDILDEEALRAVQSAAPFRRPPEPVRIVIPVSFKLT